jgi:holo-[acyl-carrier protein] synthase
MVRGIGVDITNVARFIRWCGDDRLLARFFHPAEIGDCRRQKTAGAMALAARFAAKEAFGKALGTGLRGFRLNEVQVVNDRLGKPSLVLHGRALRVFEAAGGGIVHLSLAHERENAVAMVVIEEP